MADTIDPALADQQQDPAIESLVNMDTETAQQAADSVYHAAPVDTLTTTTPQQADRENKTRTLWGKWSKLLQEKGGLSGKIASLIDPIARGAIKGESEFARTIASANDFAQQHGAHTGVLGAALNVADAVSRKAADSMGDEEYRGIAHDGLIVARKAQDLMGPDENEGFRGMVEGIAQFATVSATMPEIGAEKAVAGVVGKVAPKIAGKAAKVLTTMGKGALVDASAFDPHQERLANLLVNAPLGIGDAAKLLASNPDDSDSVGRFKASLEGIFVGSAIDAAVAAVKGGTKGIAKGLKPLFEQAGSDAPKLADFSPSANITREDGSHIAVPEPFEVVTHDDGSFAVEPNEAHSTVMGAPDPVELPKFDTVEEAQGAAAQLNYAARNATRPRISLMPEQADYLRAYSKWILDTGKFDEVQAGTLDPTTGTLHGGAHDINFRYDLTPEEGRSIIGAMSTVLREEIEGVKVSPDMMHDPKGGANISHAETLAGTVKQYDGTGAGALTGDMQALNDAVTQTRYALLASRMLRQNLAAQAEQLTRQLEAPGATAVAHQEFTKAANTLVNLFAQESALAGNVARTLESRKIKGGMFGAMVKKAALGRSLGKKGVDPLNVIRFNLVDDAALSPQELASVEEAASKRRPKSDPALARNPEGTAGMEIPMGKNPSGTKQIGTNTYTLIDEAQSKIDEALSKLENGTEDATPGKPTTDAQASKAVSNDPALMDKAFAANGVTAEDRQLAKDRLQAMKQSLAAKKEAGGRIVNLSNFDANELDDLASMHAERIKTLADAQRETPMIPTKATDVYLTRRQLRAMARQMTYVPRDEQERAKVLQTILGISKEAADNGADVNPSTWEKVVSYRAAAMLSSPKTGFVNFFSAVSQSYYRPLESFMGSAARGDAKGMQQAHDLFVGTLKSHTDAWAMAKESFEKGRTILAARDPSMPMPGAFDHSWKPVRMFMDVLGTTGKFMTSGDEFAQQLSYRGHVYAQSLRASREAGLTGEALGQALEDDMARAFNENGQGQNPAALSYAQDVTLRRPLEGGIGGMIEDGARNSKVMRVLFPFVRIPVNLVRYQMDRTPGLGMLTTRNRADFAAGGMQRNEAVGRQVAGVMFWGSGLAMADAGIITGGGPSDPELRRQWLNVNQPYSIKLPGTDTWVSYRRFEPLSTPLGIMADFHQTLGEIDADGGDKDWGQIASAFLAGVGQNLLSKTYLKSVSDLFYAIGSGKAAAMQSFLSGITTSFIPNVAQSLNPDDSMRDARGMLDRVMAQTPGLSNMLEARRNIYGEKVMKPAGYFQRVFNPFTVRSDNADDVDHELLRLGEQMSMPSNKKWGVDLKDRSLGVDGKQSPYDRWMELMSTADDGQPTLRQALKDFITSPDYKDLTDGQNGYQGSKSVAVEGIVRGYRAQAFAKMLSENPKLYQALEQSAVQKAGVLSGDPDMAEYLTKKGDAPTRSSLQHDLQSFIQ